MPKASAARGSWSGRKTRACAPRCGRSIRARPQAPYHVHHGTEELLLVLRGHPTLRTPDGERELQEGEAVHFPAGPTGAHQLVNRSNVPARFVIAASHAVPEIVEYVDEGVATA